MYFSAPAAPTSLTPRRGSVGTFSPSADSVRTFSPSGTVVDNIFESNRKKQDLIQQLKEEMAQRL